MSSRYVYVLVGKEHRTGTDRGLQFLGLYEDGPSLTRAKDYYEKAGSTVLYYTDLMVLRMEKEFGPVLE